ncbi:MAG: hypothetical protein E6594_16775 [Clostridium sporogenes]|nr:hypothetical protein [Clostridium sporogenes]
MAKFNANSAKIEDYVEEISKKSRINSFYPQTVSRKLAIPIDIVLIELSKLSEEGKIDLKYQIRCLDDLNTIQVVDAYEDILDKEICCNICGENIKVTYSNIYPVFYVNKEYKEYLKKK